MILYLFLNGNYVSSLIILIMTIFSIVFMSYNLSFYTGCLLLGVLTLTICNHILTKLGVANKINSPIFHLFIVFIIFIISMFGLSDFIYSTLIPRLNSLGSDLSATDVFTTAYFSSNTISYSDISVVYPSMIGILGSLKYILLVLCIAIVLSTDTKKILRT